MAPGCVSWLWSIGNQNESQEEVDKVAALVKKHLPGATWINNKGETLPLALTDILILAPYNARFQLWRRSFLLERESER